MSNSQNNKFKHLMYALGGFAAGTFLVKSQLEASKRSRAEIDAPEECDEVCNEIAELLEDWEPSEGCESEDDLTKDLADYLDEHSEWEIEVYPDSPEGKPDLLIGDLLALEMKVNPGKGERDRLIGQCAGYSRLWVTWALIIDSSESEIGRLVDLLEDKRLEHIAVWSF